MCELFCFVQLPFIILYKEAENKVDNDKEEEVDGEVVDENEEEVEDGHQVLQRFLGYSTQT